MESIASYPLAAHTEERGRNLAIVTVGIMLATLMQTLDTTIVNVALPIIQGNLGATLDEGAWVVTAYIVAAVIVIPLTPWLQERFGRRNYYATAIAAFTAASVMCALSGTIGQLIFWRAVQGLAGGGLVAVGQAALNDAYGKERLAQSQALFVIGAVVGPALGPTIGGWLTDNFSWNYVFYLNVIPGIVATAIVLFYLHDTEPARRVPVDGMGLSMLVVGLGSMQYVLEEGQRNDWFASGAIVFGTAAAVVGLAAFVAIELRVRRPIVDLHVFKYRSVWSGSVLALANGASLYAAMILMPQYAQSVLGMTATMTGELIFAQASAMALTTPIVAILAAKGLVDARLLIAGGLALLGTSQLMQSSVTTSGSGFDNLVPPLFLAGIGIGAAMVPISVAMVSGVAAPDVPKATALFNLSLQLGGSIATALVVTLLNTRVATRLSDLAGSIRLDHPPIAEAIRHHASPNLLFGLTAREATSLGFADVSMVVAVCVFALIPLVAILPRPPKGASVEISIG
jgi:DHA2 family multidrug resistance protein